MRAEVNRGQLRNKFKLAEDLVDNIKAETLRKAADWVVLRSPVDTGTYMDNHNIGLGNSLPLGDRLSSVGQPRHQDYTQYAETALGRMYGQINNLDGDWKRASIGNTAYHSDEVEYTHGYGVYASLRSAWGVLKQEAVNEARSRSKL